jgi:Flp pilus assembly protein TadD
MQRITLNRAWMSRRLGDAAITGVLVLAYLLSGCGGSDGEGRGTKVAEAQPAPPPVYVAAAPREDPAPAPVVEEVLEATGPVSYDEAEAAYLDGEFEKAVTRFTAYVGDKPDNAWGHFMLGLSAWKAGDHAVAESAFGEALERDPQHVKSLLGLGRVLIEAGRPEEALQEIELAVSIDSSAQVFRLKGRALDEMGRPDDAADAYLTAIARDDTDVWALNNLGYLYIRVGREDAAIGPLARAVELSPDRAVFQNNLGVALERVGYAGSAVEAYRGALAADSTFEKARVNLERVENRGIDLELTADLADLAQRFLDDVVAWRRPVVPDIGPQDSAVSAPVMSLPDSTH